MRLARVVLAAAVGLGPAAALPALPARPAAAAECVRVVVDYGTFPDAPGGPNMHCTTADTGDNAAEVLAQRAAELRQDPPRYNSSGFLCAVDGYPRGSECGDEGTKPYWSLWHWTNGRWVYSRWGMTDLTVGDYDKDGHPDPLGFRYHEFETKRQPRGNPSYPKPTTAPPPPRATTAPPPPRTAPSPVETDVTPGARATAPPSGGVELPAPSGQPVTSGPPATPTASAAAASPGAPSGTPEAEATFAAPPVSRRDGGGGAPVATFAALGLAAALLVAAGLRMRGTP